MDVTHKYEDVEALEAAFKVTEIEELISQLVDFEVESVLIAEMERDGVMNDEEELKQKLFWMNDEEYDRFKLNMTERERALLPKASEGLKQ